MKKMPSLFERDWSGRAPGGDHPVINKVNPHAAWVLDPDVPKVATRKWDGTCVMFDGTDWWARREVKPGKQAPPGFQSLGTDDVTGKVMGWEPIEQSGWKKFHAEDPDLTKGLPGFSWEPGTYEFIGPAVNGNPEGCAQHCLISRGAPSWVKQITEECVKELQAHDGSQ